MGETLGKLVALLRSPRASRMRKPKRLVEIDTAPSGRADVCTIRIRDNGIGIAESELKSIFSGFYRGHASRDGELGNSGLGLGLSIVHDCIGALKGDVHVESERGTGTTFLIELPFAPPL